MSHPEPVLLGFERGGVPCEITPVQRSTHMHVLGATGQGKSKFLENLIRQDIEHRHGVCLIDPHGSLYKEIVAWCADFGLHRKRKIHLIDPNESEWTVGFDPLRCDDPEFLSTTVDAAVDACAQVWGGEDSSKTPLLKKCLRAVFHALAAGGHSLGEALALTSAKDLSGFRAKVTGKLDDEVFQAVWDDLNALNPRDFADAFSSTNNRLIEFLASPSIRRMLRLKENALDVAKCMEDGDIVLVNLQARKISRDNARLIGTLLTNSLFTAAIRRDERVAQKRPFYLYIDECYRFLSSDVESMLDETRKFGLHVILSHQHLGQLRKYGEHIANAVMTNARTKVVFGGLSEADGEPLAKEILRETFDYNRVKEILSKPTVVGYEIITMQNWSKSVGRSVSSGESTSDSDTISVGVGGGISQSYDQYGLPLPGYSRSTSTSEAAGSTKGHGSSRSLSESFVESSGKSEALWPIFQTLPSAVEGQKEILNRAILVLRKMQPGMFVLAQPGFPPRSVSAVRMETPLVSGRRIIAFTDAARASSPFMVSTAMAEQTIANRLAGPKKVVDNPDDFSVPEAG